MLIFDKRLESNIGKALSGRFWITQKWNARYKQVQIGDDSGIPCAGNAKWMMQRTAIPQTITVQILDVNRNWDIPYQDIIITYNREVQDTALVVGGTATGHTISIGGVAQTTNYQSGSGTSKWTLRVPASIDRDDVVTYSYSQTTGNTTDVITGTELARVVADACAMNLTRRIRFALKKADGTPAASETVKYAVFQYNNGVVDGYGDHVTESNTKGMTWMLREQQGLATTDGNGVLDIPYIGNLVCGTTVYVVVIRPNVSPTQSFVWNDTIK